MTRKTTTKRSSSSTPKLWTNRSNGYTYATFNGKRVSFGREDDPATRERFETYLARWIMNGRRPLEDDKPKAADVSVETLLGLFLANRVEVKGERWHRNNAARYKGAFRPARELFAKLPAVEFSAECLVECQKALLSRMNSTTLNAAVGILKAAFRWASVTGLVPASVPAALDQVDGLQPGDYGARRQGKRGPVEQEHFEATLAYLHPVTADLARLLWHTGARPSEVYGLRPADIDRSGEVWTAKLAEHKTKHKGKDRELVFGPLAQDLLGRYLDRVPRPDETSPIFSPRMVSGRAVEDRYDANAHRRAIHRAVTRCNRERLHEILDERDDAVALELLREYRASRVEDVADSRVAELLQRLGGKAVPMWSPYQLRHAFLSRARLGWGLEGAAACGGHSASEVTDGYTEAAKREQAATIALAIG